MWGGEGRGGEKEGEGRMVIFGVNILVCICECTHMCIATPLWNVTEGTNAQTPLTHLMSMFLSNTKSQCDLFSTVCEKSVRCVGM